MKEKKEITTLFLDVGGVLLTNGWGHAYRRLAAHKFNLNITEMEERHSLMFADYEEGNITLQEYLNRVVFYQDRDFSLAAFRDFMFSLTTPYVRMIALMQSVKEQYGLKVVAVNNEARELNEYRINTFKLNGLIDFFISSSYVHIRKPSENIFKLALDVAKVSASEVLYIDDVKLFVDVATDMGINGIVHTDYQTTAKALIPFSFRLPQKNMEHA